MNKKKLSFEMKIILSAICITLVPLIFSYMIFVQEQLGNVDERIRENLRATGVNVRQSLLVQDKLSKQQNDLALQYYTQGLIQNLEDVDIIVIGDMEGTKYSHVDISQIGEKFQGADVKNVIAHGMSYYSVMEGSQGKTLRWFEPIKKDGKQIGYVMVGKYYKDIYEINIVTKMRYIGLFIISFIFTTACSKYFAYRIKKAILNMEPEEISRLYTQKEIILNSVEEGIIALDANNQISETNERAEKLLEEIKQEELLEKLRFNLQEKRFIRMQEYCIHSKKLFVSIQPIIRQQMYLGAVITILDQQEINRVAKEITGVEEINKNLRATVHEFKNNLHVILGLLQIGECEEAKKYIKQIQETKAEEENQFSHVQDYYVRALLLSRCIMAKERQARLIVTEESHLERTHGYIDSHDLITIIGNLIENALEACSNAQVQDKDVIVNLQEDEERIIIEVSDYGQQIPLEIKESLFELGTSSKGEGRGTGLYLVKNRVALYNGEIKLIEEEGEKLFEVTLPKGAV